MVLNLKCSETTVIMLFNPPPQLLKFSVYLDVFLQLTRRRKCSSDEILHLCEPKIHWGGGADLDMWLLPCSAGRYDAVAL